MAGLQTQGVVISVASTASPASYNAIGSIISFNGPGGSATVIDVTTLASTAKEKTMGLPDEGQFTLEVYVDNTDTTGQVELKTARTARTSRNFQITLTDSPQSVATFAGYVLGYAIQGGVDAAIKASITIEISGAVTWA